MINKTLKELMAVVTNMGEVGYLDYKGNPRAYVYAKVLDGLTEAKLALEALSSGLLQNAAAKAFMSIKSIVSALIVSNFGKLVEVVDGRRRVWYESVGYSAPTTGLIGVSRDLGRIGIDVDKVVRIALSLHRFSYNGLDPNLVDYRDLDEVRDDIIEVIKWVTEVKGLFRDDWDEGLGRELEELRALLNRQGVKD
jgi:hypothetical protein